ncbi:MAG: hypothetical protein AAB690_00820 [Patescibacteria group bacterium]
MKKGQIIALVLLSLILVVLLAQKTNLAAADLGRHIKNGEIMIHGGEYGLSRDALLHTNFFSYTEPDFPFVNHHWASGILFYLIFSVFGWGGLSLFGILLFVFAFIFLFLLARKKTSFVFLIPLSLFLLPLIAERAEIRPEIISYLFIAIFIYILQKFTDSTQTPSAFGTSPLAGGGNKINPPSPDKGRVGRG